MPPCCSEGAVHGFETVGVVSTCRNGLVQGRSGGRLMPVRKPQDHPQAMPRNPHVVHKPGDKRCGRRVNGEWRPATSRRPATRTRPSATGTPDLGPATEPAAAGTARDRAISRGIPRFPAAALAGPRHRCGRGPEGRGRATRTSPNATPHPGRRVNFRWAKVRAGGGLGSRCPHVPVDTTCGKLQVRPRPARRSPARRSGRPAPPASRRTRRRRPSRHRCGPAAPWRAAPRPTPSGCAR